ncbi:hypothetical protein XNC1_3123 [Xenorhabdus nematophila ATCC 19061]|uniref:Uncharacterized protein n=1 Tax=Xenorhabdus nematophila (strain ATCC 19061 / DSM 3370 / CCUG 14189 / LMG 1036 / NCIMB 9965 / AN6) TaxID=406817 RepID=D3VKR9_XENNA|nr:hypothetical protein XNC1_3123 [Xenorhabdus nematophila ATCC 19061]CEE91911.1 hypothetical protein XNA1_2470018 [Xenorhabdus nematophila str. Anatoliense]CEK23996.1 hypothetical protein XNC2_3002 [Xenorhabdus nematophila AN6/1]
MIPNRFQVVANQALTWKTKGKYTEIALYAGAPLEPLSIWRRSGEGTVL